ncbi:ribbon-helix-helix protein, CopG family [Nostoc sp.]|uniref:ribbon-helix-helix protein, CopG family n=1 Tax=Nostoc sp. TaxID=1180 RepID=UPI002FF79DD0
MKKLTVRCSDEEYKILVEHCEDADRTQNDVLRELIRKLKKSRSFRSGFKPIFSVKTGISKLLS